MYVLSPPSPSDIGEGHLIYVALGAAAVYLVCLSVSSEEPLHGDNKQAGVWTRHERFDSTRKHGNGGVWKDLENTSRKKKEPW